MARPDSVLFAKSADLLVNAPKVGGKARREIPVTIGEESTSLIVSGAPGSSWLRLSERNAPTALELGEFSNTTESGKGLGAARQDARPRTVSRYKRLVDAASAQKP